MKMIHNLIILLMPKSIKNQILKKNPAQNNKKIFMIPILRFLKFIKSICFLNKKKYYKIQKKESKYKLQ